MAKRLLSMDILRGWAILLMVIFHVFLNISHLVNTPIGSMGTIELILVAFIGIFIHWQTFFMLISAVVHWFTMSKMLKNGQSLGRILVKQLIFGFALYVFGFLREPFLSPWGMTGQWFASGGFNGGGTWYWNLWTFIYRAETLSNIGFSVMITAVLFVLLAQLNKIKLQEKFQSLIKIGILAGIAAFFIFFSDFMHNWAASISGFSDYNQMILTDAYIHSNLGTNGGYYIRWLINSLAAREFPLFPNYSLFLVGAIFGVLISQNEPKKRMLWYTGGIGGVLTLGGAAYWLFIDRFIDSLNPVFHIHPTGFILFSIGLQMVIVTIALRIFEFSPRMLVDRKRNRIVRVSRWIRRWGYFALTLFVFNIIEIIPRGALTLISVPLNNANPLIPVVDMRTAYQAQLGWTLIAVAAVVLMWEGIIRLICLAKGYPSFEFIFLALFKLGKKPIKKDPLNMQGNLKNVEPVLFVSRG